MILDVFPYFNEKELLELRIHLLRDVVDKFIILEGNRLFGTGEHRKYLCRQTIKELGLPDDKIEVVEVDLPEIPLPLRCDVEVASRSLYENTNKAAVCWARERLLRDSLTRHIARYPDDTVVFFSDCDEILRPDAIPFLARIVSQNPQYIFNVPIVSLEGRGDLRAHHRDSGLPVELNDRVFVCTKDHFNRFSPTEIRFRCAQLPPTVYATHDGEIVEDLGWHFTWMGSVDVKKQKAYRSSHAKGFVPDSVISGTIDSGEMATHFDSFLPQEDSCGVLGSKGIILKHYPITNFPPAILDIPRVKNYLFPL